MASVVSIQSSRASRPQRVLCIGRDVSLLSSSANLLTQAGYVVDFLLQPEAAVRRTSARRYHLVIISAAFTHDEQLAIRARLHRLHPRLPVLLPKPEHDAAPEFLASVAEALRPSEMLRTQPQGRNSRLAKPHR